MEEASWPNLKLHLPSKLDWRLSTSRQLAEYSGLVVSSLVIQQINAVMEKVLVTLMMIVMEVWFVEKITALLGIAVMVVIVIQHIMTGIAALPPIHATLERDTVSRITSVLEIWCVEKATVLLGEMVLIVVPPLPLLLETSFGWGITL